MNKINNVHVLLKDTNISKQIEFIDYSEVTEYLNVIFQQQNCIPFLKYNQDNIDNKIIFSIAFYIHIE